ncbi:hypothetical protein DENSPDRAFT_841458 [Dentipellis sp. KUC8613]|nr:hypothetical protein DENSPDRAFT_841458 [Dentipellis sp. KUC8613]
MASFSPTHPESSLVNAIFAKNDPQKFGVITGEVAVSIFGGAKLPSTVLGEIWSLADDENNGFLTRKGVGVAIRLIGWAQNGETVSKDRINKPGPIAVIEGYSSPAPRNAPSPSPKSPPPATLPQLTPQDRAKFTRLFVGCGPVNGILSGEKARDVFVKSKLPVDKLSQIWTLSDTQNRGSLDATDFIIAMYLIQASMSGQLSFIPTTLPPGLYDQASGKLDGVASHMTGGSGTISPSVTGTFSSRPSAGVQPQYTGQGILQPQFTGSGIRPTPAIPPRPQATLPPFPAPAQATGQAQHWDVTPSDKASSDSFFETLDTQKRGYIEGDVAVPFMLQSKLPEDVLAQVWDLADLNNDGRLTRDGFAVAMYLIQGKLVGKEIPSTLPATLIPPSMRTNVPVSSPFQTQRQQQPSHQELPRDLLWDETPAPSTTVSQPQSQILQPQQTGSRVLEPSPFVTAPSFPPQPHAARPPVQDPFASATSNADLLGDDDDTGAASPPNLDSSAEIGNVQNQLSSTKRSLESTKADRSDVENNIAQQAAQLTSLQTQLSSAKAAYETETRLLSALRDRFNGQSADIQRTREELIRAESDLSAVRVEKAELEQGLLHDKEEVRDLQRKMTETGTTIEQLKVEIEKAKKTAKQQKGLLAIAKKQLATREAEKSKAEKELQEAHTEEQEAAKEREEAEAELEKDVSSVLANGNGVQPANEKSTDSVAFAAAQPLPGTPGSPSSILSGGTTKSNNPFDRLVASNTGSSSRSQSPFLPFSNASPPTQTGSTSDALAVVPAAGANAATEDPFGFSQPFEVPSATPVAAENAAAGSEASVHTPRITPANTAVTATEEVASPTSEKDLFSTPPSTAVPLPASPSPARVSPQPAADVAAAQFPSVDAATSSIPAATTIPAPAAAPEQHEATDLNSQLKELEVDESDSSDDEDSKPLATLIKPHEAVKTGAEASVVNGKEATPKPGFSFDDAFAVPAASEAPAPLTAAAPPAVATNTTGTSPFPPPPAPAAATAIFDSVFEVPTTTTGGVSDFDEALGKIPGSAAAADASFTFDSAFEDNFDFAAAGTSFPPAPVATNGATASPLPAAAPKNDGFDSLFTPAAANNGTVSPTATAPPSSTAESKPFSFDDAFGNGPAAAPSQSTASEALGISFGDTFGGESASKALALDSAFGSTSSRGSSAPQSRSPTGPTPFPSSSPQQPTSPRGASRVSASPPPRETTPPPRVSSPKLRPSTGSSRDSHEKMPHEKLRDQPRHSKLSIRLPFGKKKKTQDSHAPPSHLSHHLAPVTDEPAGATTPAVEDDAEPVKQLCGMGFSRTQAVTALETNGYDFQRALNSLLGS